MMETLSRLLFSLVHLTLLLVNTSIIIHGGVSEAMSTITAMGKDQIPCTMCYACDNPCQPIFSPPPPSPPPPSPPLTPEPYCPPPPSPPPVSECPPPPPSPPPPSPPLTPEPYCPPPPSPPPVSECPPPPPSETPNNSPPRPEKPSKPPSGGGGGGGGGSGPGGSYYPTPGIIGLFPLPPPSNPIVPYFSSYSYSPPQPFPVSSSITRRRNPTVSSLIIIFLSSVFCM